MKTGLALSTLMQLFTLSFAFSQTSISENSDAFVSAHIPTTELSIDIEPAASMAPSFAGGNEGLTAFMRNNLMYPEIARRNGIEGTVTLEFYIKDNGTIEKIKVITSANAFLDKEAIRLVESMPRWNPAIQNGNPITVKYQLPVTFELYF